MYYVCVPLLRTHLSGVSMFCDLCVCVCVCVCLSCACIDWTVERQVSVVLLSGFFFFTCSQNADVYTGVFRLLFVFDFWELCSQSGSVCSSHDSSAFLDCSILTIMELYHFDSE